jgi:protein-S-isoprenylcysteine O-methyltransferase Ste14
MAQRDPTGGQPSPTRRRVVAAAGSTAFFLAVPGVVAGLGPWLVTGYRMDDPALAGQIAGVALILAGLAVLLDSFARFVIEGIGTPAPVAPTESLVVGGLYRHVRNPMYLAVGATIVGQALLFGEPGLLVYAAVFFVVVGGFVRLVEEPVLEADYGDEYRAYKRAVRGWWPRLRPWYSDTTGQPERRTR